ncbi:hypothetical protein CIG75_04675 [Tumebacillus algifaecis]|uniref:Arsenate reductase n=1 Tax=Tumebacillus algifaecis TaxID=1214604 RepID=A0A223CYL8_9BACL|nr:ArsC/Spx/MgsR family protein [Tumebacillus algifaecis]ASS74345.1 hypothetical protein CIG75_04675 [Tumebacillus algifaecis]
MDVIMMYHPTCSKSKRAREALADLAVPERNLEENMLTQQEILELAGELGVKVQDLLRANSPVYQERTAELFAMEEAELAALMATEPTLIRRPILKTPHGYVVGLDEEKMKELIGASQS